MISLSIVVPHYRNNLIKDLIWDILDKTKDFQDTEIIIVDDGGVFAKGNYFEEICRQVKKVKYIELTKNFGQQNAIMAGVKFANNDYIVTIDDDLQNPPKEIKKIAEYLIKNNFDLVYGSPITIKQNFFRKILSKIIRMFLSKILKIRNVNEISSFRIFKRDLFDNSSFNVSDVSIDSLLNWSTDHIGFIKVEHDSRNIGVSNYNLRKLVSLAINTIVSYSVKPLKFVSYFGLLIFATGVGLLIFTLVNYLLFDINVPGFTTIASLIILFSGTQLMILGVFGEYLARMHLNIMNKPTFVVRRTIGFN
jgi:undecaprenyl-phosphate 4-deoxy-4-formamido-L-arabinose transferase